MAPIALLIIGTIYGKKWEIFQQEVMVRMCHDLVQLG